ncbi:TetR/AcrR family transcriptional regulator [Aeromicrobium phragmitis]|uniref:TetR/AcrR family transcriptional regulator n=1 Tax=Aeromicrobium phragmitis TaxID=2478914 RepID=A0A3L8PJG3_9ACTN|nr:TetR/AcrR family transcriptional regulator [Aeromicrobium phragmitis]RLV55334.1 TetR/AcrR family transcriptional regulator [Aeromicrobium phragmitis]
MSDASAQDSGREIPSLVDVSRVRELPTTARGVRTRQSLVAAARRVFERDGFINSRLTDITQEAACSIGTFYTYFDSKEEVFTAVMQAAQDDMLHPGVQHADQDARNVPAVLEASNRAYVDAYQRNAKLMLLLEQVATIDPEFRRLRLARSMAFAQRNARWIERLQSEGYADPDLEPFMTARALSTMLGRMAYHAFALEEEGWDVDAIVSTATKIWLNALGVPADGSKRALTRS